MTQSIGEINSALAAQLPDVSTLQGCRKAVASSLGDEYWMHNGEDIATLLLREIDRLQSIAHNQE